MEQTNPLPEYAAQTSAELPWPVRHLSQKIKEYVDKMPSVWVEGQVVQFTLRPGTNIAFITLRDTDVDYSLPVSASRAVIERLPEGLNDGAHVVVQAKPGFWQRRGTLQLSASHIQTVGIGDLLARIAKLKEQLQAEGLFAAARKKPLPFAPRVIGLVTGRDSAAQRDVVENTLRRWPLVRFEIKQVAVQGVSAVTEVSRAIQELDADPSVEVIVVARGGGSVEDLLPFSNESLVRVASACQTPLVSAIGHEPDTPLLDFVADLAASTPTDAAKRIVPDVHEQREQIQQLQHRLRGNLTNFIRNQIQLLQHIRSRPALANPASLLADQLELTQQLTDRLRLAIAGMLRFATQDITNLHSQLRQLSVFSTLQRGFAIVENDQGQLISSVHETRREERITVTLRDGQIHAQTTNISERPQDDE